MALGAAERIARLQLARSERIGPVTFAQLIARYSSAQAALDALPGVIRKAGGATYTAAPRDRIEAEIASGEALGARLLVIGDADYPETLAAVDPAPPVLWARGSLDGLQKEAVAIVGARIASAGGQRIARGLASQLGEAGLIVVSGMARGIDAAAHWGALSTGTVAVLGGGVDDVYPSDNQDLYERILAEGCILSESPPGTRAQARDFPRRNRVISGLSRGVIVVEAEIRSGSLITARLAAEQGREVFAVPGSPLDPRSRGPNSLLRDGAILCERVEDVLDALGNLRSVRIKPQRPTPLEISADLDTATLRAVEASLSPTPTPRDDLARSLGLPSSVVAGALLELSLVGRARLLPGGLASR
ncbi:DNA-processing protein DprA [Brevundimonas sp.]|uniref:DNA-processing protein DprA n=1 Tax=Brevundimonas sp. TaxID=1871086 RepID=UPI001D558704|nr:DNA-processing protein DprA [Brevundimonas sp.]MBL0947310.1 DNA-protecting protein DprA [Brevundimonas sp.]